MLYPPLVCRAASLNNIELLQALKEAVRLPFFLLISKLLWQGANLVTPDYDQRTALHLAAHNGHLSTVQYLMKEGLSVHARDRWGMSPLECAISGGHDVTVEGLIAAGAHIHFGQPRTAQELCKAASVNDVKTLKVR